MTEEWCIGAHMDGVWCVDLPVAVWCYSDRECFVCRASQCSVRMSQILFLNSVESPLLMYLCVHTRICVCTHMNTCVLSAVAELKFASARNLDSA